MKRTNQCDVCLLLLITVTMIIDILLPSRMHHKTDMLTMAFIGLRYSVQLVRMIMLIKKGYENKSINSIREISFSGIDRLELDDEVNYDRLFK